MSFNPPEDSVILICPECHKTIREGELNFEWHVDPFNIDKEYRLYSCGNYGFIYDSYSWGLEDVT
ncbi:MAG: hypothetical protein ACREBJ_01660 [Nitrosotalea sp.]